MSTRVGYGQRRVRVTPEALEAWLVDGQSIETNMPDDARFVRLYPDEDGNMYHFVFESARWEELKEAEPIPDFCIEIHDDQD